MGNEQPTSDKPAHESPGDGAEEVRHPDGRIEHPAVRYEPQDVRFRGILGLMAVACCVLVVLSYLVWRFFWYQQGVQETIKESPYSSAPRLSAKPPPEPRLEQIDRMAGVESPDVNERLAAKERALDSYGPTEDKEFVHIPIQQAIKVTAGKLPVRVLSRHEATKDSGLMDAGESNSGQMFRRQQP